MQLVLVVGIMSWDSDCTLDYEHFASAQRWWMGPVRTRMKPSQISRRTDQFVALQEAHAANASCARALAGGTRERDDLLSEVERLTGALDRQTAYEASMRALVCSPFEPLTPHGSGGLQRSSAVTLATPLGSMLFCAALLFSAWKRSGNQGRRARIPRVQHAWLNHQARTRFQTWKNAVSGGSNLLEANRCRADCLRSCFLTWSSVVLSSYCGEPLRHGQFNVDALLSDEEGRTLEPAAVPADQAAMFRNARTAALRQYSSALVDAVDWDEDLDARIVSQPAVVQTIAISASDMRPTPDTPLSTMDPGTTVEPCDAACPDDCLVHACVEDERRLYIHLLREQKQRAERAEKEVERQSAEVAQLTRQLHQSILSRLASPLQFNAASQPPNQVQIEPPPMAPAPKADAREDPEDRPPQSYAWRSNSLTTTLSRSLLESGRATSFTRMASLCFSSRRHSRGEPFARDRVEQAGAVPHAPSAEAPLAAEICAPGSPAAAVSAIETSSDRGDQGAPSSPIKCKRLSGSRLAIRRIDP